MHSLSSRPRDSSYNTKGIVQCVVLNGFWWRYVNVSSGREREISRDVRQEIWTHSPRGRSLTAFVWRISSTLRRPYPPTPQARLRHPQMARKSTVWLRTNASSGLHTDHVCSLLPASLRPRRSHTHILDGRFETMSTKCHSFEG